MIVKVCGMREGANIREVENLGVDMMGFIFYPASSRYVSELPGYLPATLRVGVFVNASWEDIEAKVQTFGLEMVQLHGDEPPLFCRRLQSAGVKVIKAIPVATAEDLNVCGSYQSCCDYFLFDTKTPAYGGSGRRFDWSVLDGYNGDTPFLLSGGISETDAAAIAAIRHSAFAGVDLNSRFEVSPGLKNTWALERFIGALNDSKKL